MDVETSITQVTYGNIHLLLDGSSIKTDVLGQPQTAF